MMKRSYDVLTALDVCIDFLVIGSPEPRFGQAEQLIEDYEIEMGGSAVIFASQCARLGLSTLGVGRVGCDVFGRLFLEKLQKTGVDSSGIISDEHAKTGLGLALCRQKDRAILTYSGTINGVDREMVRAQLAGARHLHIASYYLMTALRPDWPGLVQLARQLHLTVSLDTNWDPSEQWAGLDVFAGLVDVFLPNEHEARAFTGQSDLNAAVLQLGRLFPVVAVKLGSKGAMACHQGQIFHAPGLPDIPVDTVGAGDNFDAGFIYGWLHRLPIRRCLEIGCYCGSRSVTARGGFSAQPELADLLRDMPDLQPDKGGILRDEHDQPDF